VAAVFVVRAVASGLRARPAAGALDPRAQTSLLFVGSLAVIPLVTPLPFIAIFTTTARYLVEFASGLLLVATWGAWSLYQSVRHRPWPRRAVTTAIVAIGVATIVIGFLLGISGYNDMFKSHNRPLFDRMVRAFSMCGG
jgi:hypothetical protein